MENYKSNSHKPKEEQKNEKIITGTARVKKKSGVNKLANVFVSEDACNVKSYILTDVLIPAVKKAIFDAVTNGIDLILYGETGRTTKNSNASKVSYWSGRNNENRRSISNTRNAYGYNYDDIVLDNRGEAEAVLTRMDEIIDVYHLASVADLYDLVGITGNYTDNKYGWTDIRSASIVRVRDGYMIKMPKAMPLN